MSSSPAQIAANRANSARSTGPKSQSGKDISRSNALKHGLAAEVLRTDDERRAIGAAAGEAAGPQTMGDWLKDEVITLTMRIDRAHDSEDRELERAALRAESCWDEDRRREAEHIGAGLARNPERAVSRLRATVQGCEWLIGRWQMLREAAGKDGGWTAEQMALSSDLRGIPATFRGGAIEPAKQVAMAEGATRELETVRDSLRSSDAFDRETARKGLGDEGSVELRRLHRYEASLHRRLRWCMEQLRAGSPAESVTPPPLPPVPARPPEPRPAPCDLPGDALSDLLAERPALRPASTLPGHTLPIAILAGPGRPRIG